MPRKVPPTSLLTAPPPLLAPLSPLQSLPRVVPSRRACADMYVTAACRAPQGLDDEVVEALIAPHGPRPQRLIYVSCGFKAFKRDAARLLAGSMAGGDDPAMRAPMQV